LQSAEEVARWDERKRWQQTVEKHKQKLKEKAAEAEKLSSTIRSLKETVSRLEREKLVLDSRLRTRRSGRTYVQFGLYRFPVGVTGQECDDQNM
jgi:septal ring factor EnvC (AmiA/AmiB activator)